MSEKMRYGCPKCLPDSPDEAWEAGLNLQRRHALIDDSHFHVLIASCPSCGQPFLWVFSELIDWQSGDDSQGWTLMPLTWAVPGGSVSQLCLMTEWSWQWCVGPATIGIGRIAGTLRPHARGSAARQRTLHGTVAH